MVENQQHLHIVCEAREFFGTQFLISFLKLLGELNSLIFTATISQIWGLTMSCFLNDDTRCSQRVS